LLEQATMLGERVRQALLAGKAPAESNTAATGETAVPGDAPVQGSRTMTTAHGATVVAGPRVGVMASPGAEYVAALWSTWLAGTVAVPLALTHPPAELSYVLRDAGISVVLATDEFASVLAPLASECGAHLLRLDTMTPKQARPRASRQR
jgi:acyl-CoA synthetase (AMP-forming)/AMP-acid ligase II